MNPLESIQQQCTDRITSLDFFATIPVLNELKADLEIDRQKMLGTLQSAGKIGGYVLVCAPEADANLSNIPGPFFDNIFLDVLCIVHPELAKKANGIGVSAIEMAVQVCYALHQFYPESANAPIVAEKPTIQCVSTENKIVTYLSRFKCMGGAAASLPQIATPLISNNTGSISLTCSTAGAAIFYTLDGTNASPRNPSAHLYQNDFTPGVGVTVTARAWLAGYLASQNSTLKL